MNDKTTPPSGTPASPSGSPAPSPSAASPSAPASGAPAATPTTPSAQTPTPAAAAAARPDYIPESHWDVEKNAPKETFGQHVKDLTAFQAAEQSRKLSLPQGPNDYKIALPKDWKAPQGIEFNLDDKDPLYVQAREWAHKNGISQEAFEQGIAMIASREVGTEAQLQSERTKELAKLGANATARVSSVLTWMDARGFKALPATLMTQPIVEEYEKLMQQIEGGAFSGSGREPPAGGTKEISGYEGMSFEQIREAQDKARLNSRH